MNELPAGWTRAPLSDLVDTIRPRVDPKGADGLPFIGMDHVESQTMRLLGTVPATTMRSAAVRFEPGDVLYGRLRPYLNKVYRPDFPGLASAEFIALTPRRGLDAHYLSYLLNSDEFVRFASSLNSGDRPRVSAKQIGTYLVPLPSLDQQRWIVSEVDRQLSHSEAGLASLRRGHRRLARVRAAMLNEVFARDYPKQELIDVCSAFADCEHRTPNYGTGRYVALRPRDVVGGILDLEDAGRVTEAEYVRQTRRHIPEAGDIVYSRELSYGWAAELPEASKICLGQGMVVFRLRAEIATRWVVLFLNSGIGRRRAIAAATGTAHRHINIGEIKRYPIPVPSITDQRSLIAEIDNKLTPLAAVDKELNVAMNKGRSMKDTILRRAFTGGLNGRTPVSATAPKDLDEGMTTWH